MIARHETQTEQTDVWAKLAAPLPPGSVSWRQDGRPSLRDGRYFARFVAYVDANTVRERLDTVVPGEWSLALELLPAIGAMDDGNALEPATASFKARLQIHGVVREDVGTGKDYKSAATDAFKRAAVRFGIAHELYQMGQNWVQVDGDGKYAKPLEDPQGAYERRATAQGSEGARRPAGPPLSINREAGSTDVPPCPKCGGRMWDNRIGKRNPKAPDFKCRDRSCDGVVWPPKPAAKGDTGTSEEAEPSPAPAETSELPF
jgi:hypothetical protein